MLLVYRPVGQMPYRVSTLRWLRGDVRPLGAIDGMGDQEKHPCHGFLTTFSGFPLSFKRLYRARAIHTVLKVASSSVLHTKCSLAYGSGLRLTGEHHGCTLNGVRSR